jgi:hypothetical protein
MKKQALKDQHGLFQHFQSGVADYNTRESYLAQRGGKSADPQKLYGLGPEHPESYQPKKEKPGSLSTRYVPGRPGVQALRVSAGVYQDPNTKEVFDYNEGFVTSDGRVFNGGTVDLQTDLVTLANRLDRLGLTKEASLLDSVLLKVANVSSGPCEELAGTILMGIQYAELSEDNISGLAEVLRQNCGEESCSKINEYLRSNISDEKFAKTMMGQEDFMDDPEMIKHDPEMSSDILQAALSSLKR